MLGHVINLSPPPAQHNYFIKQATMQSLVFETYTSFTPTSSDNKLEMSKTNIYISPKAFLSKLLIGKQFFKYGVHPLIFPFVSRQHSHIILKLCPHKLLLRQLSKDNILHRLMP